VLCRGHAQDALVVSEDLPDRGEPAAADVCRGRGRVCRFTGWSMTSWRVANAKSLYGGAYAVTEAVTSPGTDVVIAAGDRDQAAIVTDHVAGFLDRNEALAWSFRRRGDTWEVPARDSV